jgi:hypothetical protein
MQDSGSVVIAVSSLLSATIFSSVHGAAVLFELLNLHGKVKEKCDVTKTCSINAIADGVVH